MAIEFERQQDIEIENNRNFSRVRQFAAWVVDVYTLPRIDNQPALRHDFPGQMSQVPDFQYGDWFERQPSNKQVGFGD